MSRRLLIALVSAFWSVCALAQVAATKHNLSVSGPGAVKAAAETQICIFCHTPHNSSPRAPLWNRNDPGATYIPYSSSTTLSSPGQPNGASLLCLSCHDGTIALGNVLSRSSSITMAGGVTTMPVTSPSYLGTDLSDDHPVSMVYSELLAAFRGQLVSPSTLAGRVRLDSSGQMQCTSCHDPHDNTYGMFLVMSNQGGALCTTCHVKNFWTQSSHRLSNARWNGVQPTPWPHTTGATVSANACENCHRPHTAGGKSWLLNYAEEEQNCYSCHNGNVAQKNVQDEFFKRSRHPVENYAGTHDVTEPGIVQARHVECVDCHNPHANNGSAGGVPGSLNGVRGIDQNGLEVAQVAFEYQVCLRCHAESPGQPAQRSPRQIAQTNVRLQFAPGNPSYHPVFTPGVNTNVPSLLSPWTTASTMKCGDCHNNEAGPGAGGIGPKGPHGSDNLTLLERQYLTSDGTSESPAAYALCYKCHDRNRFISAASGASPFGGASGHVLHVVTNKAPCSVCHDPHGVSSTQGNPTNNSKLINFDSVTVTPTGGQLRFVSTGLNHGQCFLSCHGHTHNGSSY